MKTKVLMMCLALLACCALNAGAQQQTGVAQDGGGEQRVPLDSQPIVLDSLSRPAIAGQLLTKALDGTPDVPVKNARFIVENRSTSFYNYVSGSVTFYDERGVRCGEGQFTLNALAPGEQVETDAPGLRISCSPRTWRLVANNLLTRTAEVAKPTAEAVPTMTPMATTVDTPVMSMLEITVDDRVYNAPVGSTLEVPVRKRRVKITVRPAP